MNKIKFLNRIILLFLSVLFNCQILAQKPRKIFNYLQENQLSLAVEEYNKISSDKDYDNDDKVLFAYAKCLFQIDTNYQKYNPTQAIKEFNGTYILSDIKESVCKFLGKYTLSPEVINQKIINEIYREAIKLNTVDSYTNALNYYSKEHNDNTVKLLEIATYNRVKTNKAISQLKSFITKYPESIYKTEIQNLLERETLNNYKSINNIDSLNQFITQFNSSLYKPEALDFRDSIVLSNVPENYESLLAFTKKYPESKFKTEVDNRLPDVLYKEIVKDSSNFNKLNLFLNKYPNSALKKDVEKKYFSQLIEYEYVTMDYDSLLRFDGEIFGERNIHISLELIKNGSKIEGIYYDKYLRKSIKLEGYFLDRNSIILNELNDQNIKVGEFRGTLENKNEVKGEWLNLINNKKYDFRFIKKYKGYVNVFYENFHKKEKNNNYFDFQNISIKSNDKTIEKLINNTIQKNVFQKKDCNDFQCYITNLNNSIKVKYSYYSDLTSSIEMNNNHIFSCSIDEYVYEGGAHGYSTILYQNFNLYTGNEIFLYDVLYPDFESYLNEIGEKLFLEQNGNEGWDYTSFKLPKDYVFTSKGIIFKFSSYDISTYAGGRPEVLIPYNKIYSLIKTEGILYQFVK